ncbi:MAG: Fe-S cluster assembly protein SufD [Deltaproteobacteria bacterium]|nr:Fe-S cluster assembly protein SufD [Deltaproteobacteria bacterium]
MQKEIDNYVKQFEAAQTPSEPAWLGVLRRKAIERFAKTGFPSVKDEQWKHTNLAPIASLPFARDGMGSGAISPQDVSTCVSGAYANHLLVFINGRYSSRLSRPGPLPEGVRLCPLSEVLEENPALVEAPFARLTEKPVAPVADTNPFTALNTAFMEDGAVVILPMGAVVKTPIYLVFLSTGATGATGATGSQKPWIACPRNLIIAGENSQASIVEYYLGTGATGATGVAPYFNNAVTGLLVGENAVIHHDKIQEEALSSFHIASLEVDQGPSSRFVSNYVSLGGSLSANRIHARLNATGCDCALNGLYLGGGSQHMDSHTLIDHLKPNGTSNELYKGILGGRSRGVFDGKIVVHKEAQKTHAHQTNKNLLLSAEAEADPAPQLEIFADDVKVGHGSTVGRLDENQIFYLRSRGIGEKEAKGLLVSSFAGDVIEKIGVPAIKSRVKEVLSERI